MFDDKTPENGDENENEEFEPDMATVAFLDQQQAEFGNMEEEFEATYGFKHECHCGEDYAAGRVGEITQCYHNMMQEALATCARLNAELKETTAIAQALFAELQSRVEAEASSGEVQEESASEPGPSLRLVEGGRDDSDTEQLADDAAGEGLGSARFETGETDGNPVIPSINKAANADEPEDPGSPEDRKLV